MKWFSKFLLQIPKNCIELFLLILKVARVYHDTLIDKNFDLPYLKKNESEVLILGNGPSLNDVDFSKIRGDIVVSCVNDFAVKSELFFSIKPKYYVLLDPIYFLPIDKIPDLYREIVRNLYAKFELIDWEMYLIVPQVFFLTFSNKNIKIKKINSNIKYSPQNNNFLNYLYSKNLCVCGYQNVLVGALYYFIMQKTPKIYIAGADMSEFTCFKIDSNNHVIGYFSHFYKDNIIDCTDNGKIRLGEFSTYLSYYCKMLLEFKAIKYFSDYQNVKVVNLSLNSYIDVFEKGKCEDFIYT